MDILKVILQPELIALLICLCAVSGALYVLAQFVKEKEAIQKKLNTVDAELSKRRQHVEGKKEAVKERQEVLGPLKTQESEIRAYYEQLAVIQREAEAREAEEEEKEEIEVRGTTPAEKQEKTIGKRRSEWD